MPIPTTKVITIITSASSIDLEQSDIETMITSWLCASHPKEFSNGKIEFVFEQSYAGLVSCNITCTRENRS